MKYVDAHAHLDEAIFDKDRKEIINKCKEEDITIVNCGSTVESNHRMIKLFKRFPNVKIGMGIYPLDALKLDKKEFFKELEFIESQKDKIDCIGEVGIDYHWITKESEREKEEEQFKEFILLANKIKKFLNIHSRKAESKAIKILSKYSNVPVVLHYFSGNMEELKEALDNGFYISINSMVLKSKKLQKIAKATPIEKMLTETDSPYGYPGERNTPLRIPEVVEKIAEIKEIETEEVRETISKNFKKII